jgi:hypothetical protein
VRDHHLSAKIRYKQTKKFYQREKGFSPSLFITASLRAQKEDLKNSSDRGTESVQN